MVDLGGYVIILVETQDKKVKLYGSPAEKADLEVADEILEINGVSLENSSHNDVIAHIHECIKSRTICLRVKRRTGNKLVKELSENSHVQDAFVIAVEQQAKERLERLSALRKIKPVDMTKLSHQLCDSSSEFENSNPIYSASLLALDSQDGNQRQNESKSLLPFEEIFHLKNENSVTDDEIELRQNIPHTDKSESLTLESPSKREVLIGGDLISLSKSRTTDDIEYSLESSQSNKNDVKEQSSKYSLKSLLSAEEYFECVLRLVDTCETSLLEPVLSLVNHKEFKSYLKIHNTIQRVQCFQCPPNALCCDTRALVSESMVALKSCRLPEASELYDLLNKIEFEGLFFSHDKLAELQGALPWEQCVADMWIKDRPNSSLSNQNTDAVSSSRINSTNSIEGSDNNAGGDETRVIKVMKQNDPLGATVMNEGERVVIGRVVKGGAAERSGQLHAGDEVLEVNGLKLKGKSVHDICDTLCQMTGTLTFVIIPKSKSKLTNEETSQPVFHYRAHFSYNPNDDLYIPCHELGISFTRGDILHVINKEDPHWWQAYRDGDWTQTLAGLIPSSSFQEYRMTLQRQKQETGDKEPFKSPKKKLTSSPPRSSFLCAKKNKKKNTWSSPVKKKRDNKYEPYEEMALYYPQSHQKRPLVFVGPPNIGRHELRLRLLENSSRFAAAIPHTTRPRCEGEIDGQDYNFVSRAQFEEKVEHQGFVEHGEYDKQYYGTSYDAVRTVINSGKICLLNVMASSLNTLRTSDFKPYTIFLTPPSIIKDYKTDESTFKEEENKDLQSIATEMEEKYGQYFDSVLPFQNVESVYEQILYEIKLLETEPQWIPAQWLQSNNSSS